MDTKPTHEQMLAARTKAMSSRSVQALWDYYRTNAFPPEINSLIIRVAEQAFYGAAALMLLMLRDDTGSLDEEAGSMVLQNMLDECMHYELNKAADVVKRAFDETAPEQ